MGETTWYTEERSGAASGNRGRLKTAGHHIRRAVRAGILPLLFRNRKSTTSSRKSLRPIRL